MAGALSPGLARVLLRACAPGHQREALYGDIEEEFHESVLPQKGLAAARAWYWRQVVHSAPLLLSVRWQRSQVTRSVVAVCGGYLSMAAAVMLLDIGISLAFGNRQTAPMEVRGDWYPLFNVVTAIPAALLGGFVSAHAGKRAPMLHSAALACLCLLLSAGLFFGSMAQSPLWYRLSLIGVMIPATLAGGWLQSSRLGIRLQRN